MFDQEELHFQYDPGDRHDTWLRMNFISSIDGAATVGGLSGDLNDEWDLQVLHTLRSHADVVVVGAGTLREEGYDGVSVPEEFVHWRREAGLPDQPRLAIVTASANLDPDSALFAGEHPPLVFVSAAADPLKVARLEGAAEVIMCGQTSVDAERMVAELADRGLRQILCEGGPHLFGTLIEADVVDEVCLTVSPKLVAGRAGRISVTDHETVRDMRLVHALPGGPMLFLRYQRSR